MQTGSTPGEQPIQYQRSAEHEKLLQSLNTAGKSGTAGHLYRLVKDISAGLTTGKASSSMDKSLAYIKEFTNKIAVDTDAEAKFKEALAQDPKLRKAVEKMDKKIKNAVTEMREEGVVIRGTKAQLNSLGAKKFADFAKIAREIEVSGATVNPLGTEEKGSTTSVKERMRRMSESVKAGAEEQKPVVAELKKSVSSLFDSAVASVRKLNQSPEEKETAKLKQEMQAISVEINKLSQNQDAAMEKICGRWNTILKSDNNAHTYNGGRDLWRNAPKTKLIVNGEERQASGNAEARQQALEQVHAMSESGFEMPSDSLFSEEAKGGGDALGNWARDHDAQLDDKAKKLIKSSAQEIYTALMPDIFMSVSKHAESDVYAQCNVADIRFVREIRADGTSSFTVEQKIELHSKSIHEAKVQTEMQQGNSKIGPSQAMATLGLSITVEYDENMNATKVSYKTGSPEELAFNDKAIQEGVANKIATKK